MLKVIDNLIAKPLMRQAYIAPLCAMIVFCAGVAVTYLLQDNAYSVAQEIQADRFARKAENVLERIKARMLTYEQVLRGLSSMYISSESVSRPAFRD
jgi:CHASE1-domain containing sensor protein